MSDRIAAHKAALGLGRGQFPTHTGGFAAPKDPDRQWDFYDGDEVNAMCGRDADRRELPRETGIMERERDKRSHGRSGEIGRVDRTGELRAGIIGPLPRSEPDPDQYIPFGAACRLPYPYVPHQVNVWGIPDESGRTLRDYGSDKYIPPRK